MTKLTGNKLSLKNPGESPRQEVLFPILGDLCVPLAADKNLNTPPRGKVSQNILKGALISVVFLKKKKKRVKDARLLLC